MEEDKNEKDKKILIKLLEFLINNLGTIIWYSILIAITYPQIKNFNIYS